MSQFPLKNIGGFLFAGFSGFVIIFFIVKPHGIGLSQDSINYISAARSLLQNGALRDISGAPFLAWPPLYPLAISFIKLFAKNEAAGLLFLNLIAFLLFTITNLKLVTTFIEKIFFRILCFAAITFSFTILQVFSTALSESFFLVMINATVLLTLHWTFQKKYQIFIISVVVALAMLQRYAAIFLLLPVLIIFVKKKVSRRDILLFLGLSILPLSIWVVRNFWLSGTFTGTRISGDLLFWKNVYIFCETISSWILPLKIPFQIRVFFFTIVLLIFLKESIFYKNAITYLLLPTVVYFLMLLFLYFLFSFEEPRDRLLAPVFPLFMIFIFHSIEKYFLKFNNRLWKRSIFFSALFLFLLYPAIRSVKHVLQWRKNGIDVYNDPIWAKSETIRTIRERKFDEEILSNDAHAVYFFGGKNAIQIPKNIYGDHQIFTVHDKYLVWFNDERRYEFHNLQNVKKTFQLHEIFSGNDGSIYKIGNKK